VGCIYALLLLTLALRAGGGPAGVSAAGVLGVAGAWALLVVGGRA